MAPGVTVVAVCSPVLMADLHLSHYLSERQIERERDHKGHTEVKFLDVIGTKVLRVFLLAIDSHLYQRVYPTPPPLPQQKWFETGL
jgi:hypothetical protein